MISVILNHSFPLKTGALYCKNTVSIVTTITLSSSQIHSIVEITFSMNALYVFKLLCIVCTVQSMKHIHPTKLVRHNAHNGLQKSIFHVGTIIAIAGSIVSTSLYPLSAANAVGPTQVQLTITGYKQVELCDGRKPIMPGQKAMEGLSCNDASNSF